MKDPAYVWARLIQKTKGRAVQHSTIHPSSKVEAGSTVVDSTMGPHSFCGYDCTIIRTDIGRFCSIANRVSVGNVGSHPMHFVSTSPTFLSHRDSVRTKFARLVYTDDTRTLVGSDVWIGEGAFIKSGVRIGHGAVIGMGSVVTRDVEPYQICAGNPARPIRWRFDADVREGLLRSAWWDWSDQELAVAGSEFGDPVAFLTNRGLL